jgi:hypothetical protein
VPAAQTAPNLEYQSEAQVYGSGYSIRHVVLSDAADLAALDAALSPPHLPGLTEDEIRSWLQRFPTEQLVLCTLSGDVVGALYM